MSTRDTLAAAITAGLFFLSVSAQSAAEPIIPTSDQQIIEVLPSAVMGKDEQRRMRKLLIARPTDARLAVIVAHRDLDLARDVGDPRFAGQALAALANWDDSTLAPADVVLVRATIQQFLHQFDEAKVALRGLVARPDGARMAQAWLTLATVLRVQGRYAESDEACRGVSNAGAETYGRACLAENAGLTGHTAAARAELESLLSYPSPTSRTRGWLLTSLAELEQRDGRVAAADAAFRAALKTDPNAYVAVDAADFLIDQHRPVEAMRVLDGKPRTDAVLLRLAIAAHQNHSNNESQDVTEMRDRIALENTRLHAKILHGREQALFALLVDGNAQYAAALARGDVTQQREPIDVLVFARSAKAAGNTPLLEEAKRLQREMGLHDRRIDAVH